MEKIKQTENTKQTRMDICLSEELNKRLMDFCFSNNLPKRSVINIAINDFLEERGF